MFGNRLLGYRAIERSPPPGPDRPWYEVVGVVGDLGRENGYGRGGQGRLVAAYALVIACVCMLAYVGPMLRGLAIEPTEAMRTG